MTQTFEIPWAPTSQGRPRFARAGAHVRTYTPAPTRNAVAAIRVILTSQKAWMYDRALPLRVEVIFRVKRPVSAPKRVQHPVTRPDLDGYIKLILDAATGVLWSDDAQIVEIVARKTYDLSGGASMLLEVGAA